MFEGVRSKELRMHQRVGLTILTFFTLLVSACSSPPILQLIEVTERPSETVPLAALLTLQTDQPTTVSLEFSDGERSWDVEPESDLATRHQIPLIGMRPGRTHTVRVEVIDQGGRIAASQPLEITTPPLPESFPPLEARISEPELMEPGFTMFNLTNRNSNGRDETGPLVIVDEAGEVVWYYWTDHLVGDARRLGNGSILYQSGRDGRIYEIDMLGNVISQWTSDRTFEELVLPGNIPVDTDTFHHDAFETASGNILAISSELRNFDDFPSSTDPDASRLTSEVVGDILVEFGRDGQLLREVRLLDVLDPLRISYNSLGAGYWTSVYGQPEGLPRRDWAHTNAVVMDASETYAIASMRHQDAVVKINMDTGELVWILGDHGGWGPEWQEYLLESVGDLVWPYHQHAPMITPAGNILMFDNGNNRAVAFEERVPIEDSFSRAVEYAVDEDNMTVTQVWSYGGGPEDETYFANFVSDADWMPQTGNVLIDFGGLVSDDEGQFVAGGTHNWTRIVEVTHETPARKVFELFVNAAPPDGWFSFRAERIPSVYP